jgi:hypothetical protein
MCFYLLEKDITEYIAEEDIMCYKVLDAFNGEYYAPIYNFIYKRRKTYTLKCNIKIYPPSILEYNMPIFAVIQEGFHSLQGFDILDIVKYGGNAIAEFIIPKGAHYYKNKTEYVSDQIKMIKIVYRK